MDLAKDILSSMKASSWEVNDHKNKLRGVWLQGKEEREKKSQKQSGKKLFRLGIDHDLFLWLIALSP